MLALIGNAPSSGSTLLADLLDATDFTAAGPELGYFATTDAYRFDGGRQQAKASSPATLYTTGVGVYRRGLPGYGLDSDLLQELHDAAPDFDGFSRAFVDRYLALRDKRPDGVVFEKTPQNINRIGDYLGSSRDGAFVFLVRNPTAVHRSLRKRGYTTWQAIGTWLVAAAFYLAHRPDPRVRLVRFEELVERPYDTASGLIADVTGRQIEPDLLEANHQQNRYRGLFETRLPSWGVQASTRVASDADRTTQSEDDRAVASMLAFRVSTEYAKRHGLAEVSVEEALAELGYEAEAERLRELDEPCIRVAAADRAFCLRRWGAAFKRSQAGFVDLPYYLKPLVPRPKRAA